MTQPTERRFVMEPRLDAEVETLNTAISAEATARTNADNAEATARANADSAESTARIAGDALKVAKAGDTMTGALVLPADPTLALQAATKQYVDNAVATGETSGSRTIAVKNGSSSLTKGQPVYISGANGTNVIISAAGNGSEATSSKTIGLVTTALSANAMGVVITNGLLSGLDTSGAGAAGDPVWLGPSGTLLYGIAAKPVAPAHLVYIGIVTKKNGSTGEILVNPQNGFELDELHNVLITSPTNGQALTYETSSGLWKNATPASNLDSLTDVTITTPSGGQVLKYNSGSSQWVNGAAAGGVTAADTAPSLSTAAAGDAWFDTNDGTLYVCYVDIDSTKQWVQVQANSALEASILSRVGALESQAIALGTYSPNYMLNADMSINQRAFTTTGSTGYGLDRWATYNSGGTTYSVQAFAPGIASTIGYEATNYARLVTTGQTGTSAYTQFAQKIEDVKTIAGKTVTISFWAKAASGTPKVAVEFQQNFGTGGSPSSSVETYAGQVTLSTSWARYSLTINVPSISGKTIGTTASTSFTQVSLWVSAGTDFNARAGSIGIQSNTFDIWGMQVEKGSAATSFRNNQPNQQAELAACQRYYYRINAYGGGYAMVHGTSVSSSTVEFNIFKDMRSAVSSVDSSGIGIYRLAGQSVSPSGPTIYATTTTNTIVRFSGSAGMFTTTPENVIIYATGSPAYIGLSAEL